MCHVWRFGRNPSATFWPCTGPPPWHRSVEQELVRRRHCVGERRCVDDGLARDEAGRLRLRLSECEVRRVGQLLVELRWQCLGELVGCCRRRLGLTPLFPATSRRGARLELVDQLPRTAPVVRAYHPPPPPGTQPIGGQAATGKYPKVEVSFTPRKRLRSRSGADRRDGSARLGTVGKKATQTPQCTLPSTRCWKARTPARPGCQHGAHHAPCLQYEVDPSKQTIYRGTGGGEFKPGQLDAWKKALAAGKTVDLSVPSCRTPTTRRLGRQQLPLCHRPRRADA